MQEVPLTPGQMEALRGAMMRERLAEEKVREVRRELSGYLVMLGVSDDEDGWRLDTTTDPWRLVKHGES